MICAHTGLVPAKNHFQPGCFSSLESNPGNNIFHVWWETSLEWASSRQGLFPAKCFFQAEAFSSPIQFPASHRSPYGSDECSKVLAVQRLRVEKQIAFANFQEKRCERNSFLTRSCFGAEVINGRERTIGRHEFKATNSKGLPVIQNSNCTARI